MPQQIVTIGQELTAFAYEALTVDATSGGVALTSGTYSPTTFGPAHRAHCTLETAQIRFTYDGTPPTASVGHLLEVGDTLIIEGVSNIKNFKAIRTGATSGSLRVTYERFRLGV